MSPDSLFSVCNTLVLPAWLLLLVAPRWRWTTRVAIIVPLLLATTYLVLIAANFRPGQGGFGSLEQVARLFTNPNLLLAGWVHYLAFDLFTGAWEVRDAAQLGIRHVLVIPCLVLTFLFGPIGLLLYFALRSTTRGLVAMK
ncbi:MAG TPA: ABA4-like family protein [Bryobacteraceae bacterium]|nr:ABA4-like family protein [Bryobacteraceae bacterium]